MKEKKEFWRKHLKYNKQEHYEITRQKKTSNRSEAKVIDEIWTKLKG